LRNNASRWLLLQEYITMHGPLNVKIIHLVCPAITNFYFVNATLNALPEYFVHI